MEITEFIPSLADFKNLVNVDNFSQVDIDLQNKTSSTVGYDNFEHYLEFQYFIYLNLYKINELVTKISQDYEIHQKLKVSLDSILEKYNDTSIEEELKTITDRLQKLPIEIQTRLNKFESLLRILFIKSMFDKISENEKLALLVKSMLNDFANQYSLTRPEAKQSLLSAISYLEGISFNNTNRLINLTA